MMLNHLYALSIKVRYIGLSYSVLCDIVWKRRDSLLFVNSFNTLLKSHMQGNEVSQALSFLSN